MRLAEAPARGPDHAGEHRQITVMFSDLVGSTQLSAELHAEDLRDVLNAYQEICAEEIESRGGMIASYMGDGVMAYFGYPRASEDAAVNATDAGLGITARVMRLGQRLATDRDISLAARVALHTGRVLVGAIGAGDHRDPHAITGIVPNLAARLEGIAPKNALVISAQTRALLGDLFTLVTMGDYDLKGIPEPVEVFRVEGRKPGGSALLERRRPLVAREAELTRLEAAWAEAEAGAAVRAAIVAEPGTGKTALAAHFIAKAGIAPEHVIEFAGALGARNSPFACLRQTIDRHLQAAGAATEAEARAALARWLAGSAASPDAVPAEHVSTMLALWQGDGQDGSDGRNTIFAAAAALIAGMQPPVLLVLEDAHWIDPSTLELLDRVITAPGGGRLALILTRPDDGRDWSRTVDVSIALGRLAGADCRALVEAVAGSAVEASLVRKIDAATDGLPLYVEEFTKALIESGVVRRQRGVLRAVRLEASVETPGSLLDLITSRLDLLGGAKAMAQIAAVLGRSFDATALVAVSGRPPAEVTAALDALEAAGILSRDEPGHLSFRHALYQKAAYESLLRSARRTWHRRYLDWLQGAPERLASVRPETIAFHLEACGERIVAAERYIEAGLAANRASASLEAAAHFRRASDLLAEAPEALLVAVQRLRAQVLLAGALLSARGPGSPETRKTYDEALRLAEVTPEGEWHLAAYWGWWRVSENFAAMAARGRQLLEVSKRMQGAEFKLQSMHCAWATSFNMGELEASVRIARDGLELYEEAGFAELSTLYGGHDCKVCALGETGLATWLQGAGDAAADCTEQALAHADAIGHLGSLLHALDIAVMLDHYRRDGMAVSRHAERLMALGVRHDLEEYRAKADIFLGWRDIDAGRLEAGLARIDAGFRVMQEVGTPEDFPVYQCMRAEALRRLGDVDAALAALAEGRAVIVEQGVAFWAAEIARHEAMAEMARTRPDEALVREKLAEAQGIAASQGALALELRVALTALAFAQMTGAQASGEAKAARHALAAVLGRFAPGARGRDLDEARAALAPAAAS
jgi:class 3 adenylate cyclase/predicted ATPase